MIVSISASRMKVTDRTGIVHDTASSEANAKEKNRLIKFEVPGFIDKAGLRQRSCQWLCAGLLAFAIAGCETRKQQVSGEIGSAEGFAGAVVADEPRAVLAARDA